jgi:hypothetical protein
MVSLSLLKDVVSNRELTNLDDRLTSAMIDSRRHCSQIPSQWSNVYLCESLLRSLIRERRVFGKVA